MEENKVLLDVQGLKMHFPVRGKGLSKNGGVLKAVDDVSFSIQRGRTSVWLENPAAARRRWAAPS